MTTLLVPVDGSPCSDRAVEHASQLARELPAADIHLLNVQPRIFSEPSLVFLPADRLDSYYYAQSEKALASAEKLLRQAGVDFTVHRSVGQPAEEIVAKAQELRADAIVMGTHGHGKLAGMLVGSVALKVLHLSPIPVTLVRAPPATGVPGPTGMP